MLDKEIIDQVKGLFQNLKSRYTLTAVIDDNHAKAAEMRAFLVDFCSCSPKLELIVDAAVKNDDTGRATVPAFAISKDGTPTGITFLGIPGGHEFTSLLLAILNADGAGKNLPDKALADRIKTVKGPVKLRTYMSLSCTNCPDVVQALNIITLLNGGVSHEIADGELHQEEVDRLGIQGVPTVYADGELLHIGRGELGALLQKLEDRYGSADEPASTIASQPSTRDYDVIVAGGGPAGSSAAIYSVRKGLRVAIIGERIGGQVKDTTGIENLISVPLTTGTQLAADLKTHLDRYPIDVFENRTVTHADLRDATKTIYCQGGESFRAPAVIISTGAGWRRLGVEGESEHIGHGVAFCPHCDGPFFKGKHVAVIGGGNSGIEAAIDLAGICRQVTVIEFADKLRADAVLQEKAAAMPNVEIFKSMQTTRIIGDGKQVTGIEVRNRKDDKTNIIPLDGVFLQIGLAANSRPFADSLDLTERKEIKTDAFCRTSLKGVYAAGDVTDVPYKQIIIAMGEGAKAALSAFDDRVRGVIPS